MLYKDEIYIEQKFEQVKFVDSYGIAQDCLTYKIDRLDRFYDIGKNEHIQYNNKLGITIWNARTSMFLNVEKSDIMPKKKCN